MTTRALLFAASCAVAAALAGCPFGKGTINELPLACSDKQDDCGPDQICRIENTETDPTNPRGHCFNKDGLDCTWDGECVGGKCLDGRCWCSDREADNGETDVDCGGPCASCRDAMLCKVDADCQSGNCGHLWSELHCVPPLGHRMVSGKYVGTACTCPQGTPCSSESCLALEVCDGQLCRSACEEQAHCSFAEGNICDQGVCKPKVACGTEAAAFFCTVPAGGDAGARERWGFATCKDGVVVCEALQ